MFKRKLNRVETIALSVAVIAMMVGISLNTPFIAATAGTAVPLVFVISTIGVLCIALSFVRLASKVGHAGSVYGLIYYAQGRNFGFIAGWAILLTYAVFVTAALCGFGLFASGLLAPVVNIPWPVYAIACAFLVWFITDRDIKLSTRLMLTIELFSVTLVLILSIVIVSVTKFTPAPFHIGSAGIGGLSQGLVFGVLTFIGFEAASSLGEEAQNPVRDVPFAIITTVLVAGAFFTFVGYAQTVGYGLGNISKFANAAAPFQDLAPQYGGAVMSGLIQFGALVSTFAMAVGSAAAAARLLVALARDGFLPNSLASVNKYGSPRVAGNLVMIMNLVLLAVLAVWHNNASDLYGYTGTVATLTVLIAYGMMNIASLIHFTKQDLQAGRWYMPVPPVVGLVLAAYALFANIYPVPAFPFNYFPYLVIAYMAAGGAVLVASRRRVPHVDMAQYEFTVLRNVTEVS
jgi:amino acid transporter